MCDIFLGIVKFLFAEYTNYIIAQFIFSILIIYIAFDFFIKKKGHFYHNDDLDKRGYNPDTVLMFKESKNILGLVTFYQYFFYMLTIFISKGLGDTFSLIIPLLYTYIFDNMYSIIANHKNIHEDIQKSDLDKVKISSIILIAGSIIFAGLIAPTLNNDSKNYVIYYNTLCSSIIIAYFATLFMMHYPKRK